MKLTKKDHKRCEVLMKKWRAKLGLLNYKIYLRIVENSDNEQKGELFPCQGIDRVANIFLNSNYEFKHIEDVEETIFHELLELMLHDLRLASSLQIETTNKMCHEVIRRLENLIFEQ